MDSSLLIYFIMLGVVWLIFKSNVTCTGITVHFMQRVIDFDQPLHCVASDLGLPSLFISFSYDSRPYKHTYFHVVLFGYLVNMSVH